ncbi:hypothetical protein [Coleofasciculus sp. FACHB-1120]|nr:hypothetical protein [Coleofasciculus sp. FACHB-1120]MBD2740986.1 hypothetical protein [Coleofasciculus sp. FACHB-1120]
MFVFIHIEIEKDAIASFPKLGESTPTTSSGLFPQPQCETRSRSLNQNK